MGASFQNIVLPNEIDHNYDPDQNYNPVSFQSCNLTNTQFMDCDLSNVEIKNCDISGLKINGVLIEELLKTFEKK